MDPASMTRRSVAVLLFVAGSLYAAAQPPTPPRPQRPGEIVRGPRPAADPAAEGTGTIRGRVTGSDGRPLRLARLSIVEGTTRKSVGESTDADGRYEFAGVAAGTYAVTARKAGYATMEFGQRRPTDPARRVRVINDQVVEHIDFTLPAAAALSGRVIDENGDPVQAATVSLYTMTFVNGRPRLIASGVARRTDDLGRFRLFNVDPGEYVISAAAATVGTYRLPGYAPMYFPGTPSVTDAQVLTVKTGEDLFGLDLRLAPGRAAKVSGVALDAAGQPFEGLLVLDTSQHSNVIAAPAAHARPRPDGQFEFVNVPAGDYVLQAFVRGRNGAEFATRFVSIGDGDATGLTVRTAFGSTVTGRITLEGARPRIMPRDFQFNFVTTNEDLAPEPGMYRARINDDWTFEYEGLFGPLLIRPTGRPEWLLRSVRVNGIDVTDTVLAFGRPADSLSEVEVVLTSRGAEVSGAVTDARGPALNSYTVIVFSTDRERWMRHSRFVKAAASEPDGTFSVRGLPTGEYFVAAIDRVRMSDGSGEWQDPAFLEALAPAAERAALIEGQTTAAFPKLVVR
jgi:Carboxypeptidase regulatory-like domain